MIPVPSMLAGDLGGSVAPLPLTISYVGAIGASGSSATPTAAQPAGVQAGDLGIFAIKNGLTFTPPAGWTLVDGIYYKVYGASEGSIVGSLSGSNSWAIAGVVYRNVDPASPVQDNDVIATAAGATSHPAPALTATTVNTRAVCALRIQSSTTAAYTVTDPAGFTRRGIFNRNAAHGAVIADMTGIADGGSTGAPSWGSSIATATFGSAATMLLLNPKAA